MRMRTAGAAEGVPVQLELHSRILSQKETETLELKIITLKTGR